MADPVLLNRKKVDEMSRFTAIRRGSVKALKEVGGINVAKIQLVDMGLELDNVDIASSMAHNASGIVAVPSVGDEVLVGFVDDSINRPVILGSLYSAKNLPPLKVDSNSNNDSDINITLPAGDASEGKAGLSMVVSYKTSEKQKVTIKTQKGHIIELDDENETATIKAKSGKTFLVMKLKENEGAIELQADKTISMKAGNNIIKLDSENGFDVNCQKGDLKFAAQNTKYDNKANFEIAAQSNFKVGAAQVALRANGGFEASGATAKVTANSDMDLNANAIMTIKGSMTKIN